MTVQQQAAAQKQDAQQETIGSMTRQELDQFVRVIMQRMRVGFPYKAASERTASEILASVRKNRIVPKPGTPSTLVLLREDRDQ
jgi:hypothetical protein